MALSVLAATVAAAAMTSAAADGAVADALAVEDRDNDYHHSSNFPWNEFFFRLPTLVSLLSSSCEEDDHHRPPPPPESGATNVGEEVENGTDDNDNDNDNDDLNDPYANLPPEDEETTCSLCLTFRQGPCRPYWRKLERCFKDHEKEEQGAAHCMRYFSRHQQCLMKYGNLYQLVSLEMEQELVYDAERSVAPHERRRWLPTLPTQTAKSSSTFTPTTTTTTKATMTGTGTDIDPTMIAPTPPIDWQSWQSFIKEAGWGFRQIITDPTGGSTMSPPSLSSLLSTATTAAAAAASEVLPSKSTFWFRQPPGQTKQARKALVREPVPYWKRLPPNTEPVLITATASILRQQPVQVITTLNGKIDDTTKATTTTSTTATFQSSSSATNIENGSNRTNNDGSNAYLLKIAYAIDQDGLVLGLVYNREYGALLDQIGQQENQQQEQQKDSRLGALSSSSSPDPPNGHDSRSNRVADEKSIPTKVGNSSKKADDGKDRLGNDSTSAEQVLGLDFILLPGATSEVQICALYTENPTTAPSDRELLHVLLYESDWYDLREMSKEK